MDPVTIFIITIISLVFAGSGAYSLYTLFVPKTCVSPIGSYCDSISGTVLECPKGTSCPAENMTVYNHCPTGYYCPTPKEQPIICPAGYFCPNLCTIPQIL